MNCKLLTNLLKAIKEKQNVYMKGHEIQGLSPYSEYWGVIDTYLTKAQKSSISRPQHGCVDLA